MANPGRRITLRRRPWRPGLCADCHRKPRKTERGKTSLRRGLCMACYQYRRRKGRAMPPKMASVIYRPKATDTRSEIATSAWDRFR